MSEDKLNSFLTWIQPQLGSEVHVGKWLKIDQERINQFADVTGDQQWIHTNPERAGQESPFTTTIAHGYLTLSLLPYLTEQIDSDYFQKNYPGMAYQVNYGLNKVRFPAPVRVDSSLRARTTLQDAVKTNGAIQLTYLINIEIAGEPKPACVAEYLVRLYP